MASIDASKVIPTWQSKAEDWIAWYKLIPGGKDVRNMAWLAIWRKNGNPDANTHELKAYMREQGINLTDNGLGSIVDSVLSFKDGVENFLGISFWVFVAIGSSAAIVAAVMIYQAVKNPDSTSGKIIQMAVPQSRAASILKGLK